MAKPLEIYRWNCYLLPVLLLDFSELLVSPEDFEVPVEPLPPDLLSEELALLPDRCVVVLFVAD